MVVKFINNLGGLVHGASSASSYTAHITTAFVNGECVGWCVARNYTESDKMASEMVVDRFGVAR